MTRTATRRRFVAHCAVVVCVLVPGTLGACAGGDSGREVGNQNEQLKRRYEKWRAARLKEDEQLRNRQRRDN